MSEMSATVRGPAVSRWPPFAEVTGGIRLPGVIGSRPPRAQMAGKVAAVASGWRAVAPRAARGRAGEDGGVAGSRPPRPPTCAGNEGAVRAFAEGGCGSHYVMA